MFGIYRGRARPARAAVLVCLVLALGCGLGQERGLEAASWSLYSNDPNTISESSRTLLRGGSRSLPHLEKSVAAWRVDYRTIRNYANRQAALVGLSHPYVREADAKLSALAAAIVRANSIRTEIAE